MKNKILFLTCMAIFYASGLWAQTDSVFWNAAMKKIAGPTSNADWINIKQDIEINPLTFFVNYKQALRLGINDEMRLDKTLADKIGMTHYRYQQFYKGHKILFAEFYLHANEGRLQTANGKMIRGLHKNVVINISKNEALQYALRFLPAARYAWQIPQLENGYKEVMHDPNATYFPAAELDWINTGEKDDSENASAYELAYMFDIYPASMNGKKILVSAVNGKIIKSFPLSAQCDVTSTTTNFYGSQSFFTRLIPGSSPARWNLWNDCQTAFIHTRQWLTDSTSNEYISSASNNWTAAGSAATSHWATERAYSYFLGIHGRNGWNNSNAGVNVYQDALFCNTPGPGCVPNSANNASMSFTGGVMKVGNVGNAFTIDDWNSMDIIAHEFTHAVTASSFGNLNYSKESGALNESFSDIFGVTCHAWLFGLGTNTWKVGFDRKNPDNTTQSLYIRNMANPKDKGQPDTYKSEPQWYNTDSTNAGNDFWGVHTNSGVQNYMYYLLVSGGIGTNDFGNSYSLIGIGIVAARAIAYRALTVGYLFSNSDFAQARTAWVHAAVDIYGECSLQAIETGKAWDAVGLPPPLNNITNNICGTFGGLVYTVTKPGIYLLAPGCAMTVIPSSLVEFGARQVVLKGGFRAQPGSKFRAYTSDCRFAAY